MCSALKQQRLPLLPGPAFSQIRDHVTEPVRCIAPVHQYRALGRFRIAAAHVVGDDAVLAHGVGNTFSTRDRIQ